MDVDYLDKEALITIKDLADQGFPVCVKKKPKGPGKTKSSDYQTLVSQFLSLDNVSSDLNKVVSHDPLIESSSELEYWAKVQKDQYMIFISHPKARGLKYPLEYGQSIL